MYKLFYIYRNKNAKKIAKQPKISIKPAKILVIRTDRIGDVILTLPVIDALKSCFPEAQIDMLVQSRVYELVRDYPNINKVHSIEKVSPGEIKQICKAAKYDLGIVVHPRFSVALGLFMGGVKYRLGTAYRWYAFLFNIKHHQHRKDSVKHELEYNIDLLTELGCIPTSYSKPVLEVSDEVLSSVKDKLKDIGVDLSKDIVAIHIPSLGSAKVWSDKNFVELISMINNDSSMNLNIVLTGTEDDRKQVENVISKIENNKNIFPILNFNLKELAALLKISKLFIGNSTGPIHIAAAVGTFCVGLYSPVKVETATRWGPYTEKKKIFQPEADDASRNVMDDITPKEVYEAVKQISNNK